MQGLVQDKLLGPAAPDLGWVPAPRYLLRRRRILHHLQHIPSGKVLEIGPGAGMLMQELAMRGFSCSALESSPLARDLIDQIGRKSGNIIDLNNAPNDHWRENFPLVMAFEVLEHIEDDHAALTQWASWIEPGGTLLLSVPAHPSQWNAADIWAGHYRRYSKKDLTSLIDGSGLLIEKLECIGFPLGNLTEKMQARSIERGTEGASIEPDRKSNNDRSGTDRKQILKWYPLMQSPAGRLALRGAFTMQYIFKSLPFGISYFIRARKPQ